MECPACKNKILGNNLYYCPYCKKRLKPLLPPIAWILLALAVTTGSIGVVIVIDRVISQELVPISTFSLITTPEPFVTPVKPSVTPVPPMPTATLPPTARSINPVTANDQWTPQFQIFDGVEMALVPPGCFMMGSDDPGFNTSLEAPKTQVCFNEPFWIDRYEVTNAQYGSSGTFSGPDRPRETVLWYEAMNHCTGRNARLPTEAEWEYAARGPDDLRYPWGNSFDARKVVYAANSDGKTSPVGSKPGGASWVGALDMSGNVWEWTSTVSMPYPYQANDGRENINSPARRILRGGAWDSTNDYVMRTAFRYDGRLDEKYSYWGFRCVHFANNSSIIASVATHTFIPLPTDTFSLVPPNMPLPSDTLNLGNVNPIADQVLYASDSSEATTGTLYLLNLVSGSSRTVVSSIQGTIIISSMRPDGQQIVFEACYATRCNVYRVDSTGRNLKQLTFNGRSRYPRWNPNGKSIVFASVDYQIFAMSPDGSNVRFITNGYAPAWDPSGTELVFQNNSGGEDHIFRFNLQTRQSVQVTSGPSGEVAPVWSPDGRKIAYYSLPETTSQIFVVNVDGTSNRQVTYNSIPSFAPCWDGSSTWLIFHRKINGMRSLIELNILTGQEVVILSDGNSNHNPTW